VDHHIGQLASVHRSCDSSPVGVFPKPENCVFVPVPCELRFHDAERSGGISPFTFKFRDSLIPLIVDLLSTTAESPYQTTTQPLADLEILERSIKNTCSMLDRVLTYVRSVLSGDAKGDPAVGRYLMDTLGTNTDGLEKSGFNASLQVCVKCIPIPLVIDC